MDTSTVSNLASTTALLAGLVFAGLQVRAAQRQRTRDTMIQLMQSFSTFEFVKGITALITIPDGLSKPEFEKALGDRLEYARAVLFALESIGVLVHKREIPIEMAEDFFTGPTMLSWRKASRYVRELRESNGIRTSLEYWEWFADVIHDRRKNAAREPAYIAYRDWKP